MSRHRRRLILTWITALFTSVRLASVPMGTIAVVRLGLRPGAFEYLPVAITLGTFLGVLLVALADVVDSRRSYLFAMAAVPLGALMLAGTVFVHQRLQILAGLGPVAVVWWCGLAWFLMNGQARAVEQLEAIEDRSPEVISASRAAQTWCQPVAYLVLLPAAALPIWWAWEAIYAIVAVVLVAGLVVLVRLTPTPRARARGGDMVAALAELPSSATYLLGLAAAFLGRASQYSIYVGLTAAGMSLARRADTPWAPIILASVAVAAALIPRIGALSNASPLLSVIPIRILALIPPLILLAAASVPALSRGVVILGAFPVPIYVLACVAAYPLAEVAYQSGQHANRVQTRGQNPAHGAVRDAVHVLIRDLAPVLAAGITPALLLTRGEQTVWLMAEGFAVGGVLASLAWLLVYRIQRPREWADALADWHTRLLRP